MCMYWILRVNANKLKMLTIQQQFHRKSLQRQWHSYFIRVFSRWWVWNWGLENVYPPWYFSGLPRKCRASVPNMSHYVVLHLHENIQGHYFFYCFERVKDSRAVTYLNEITQDLSRKWCQWRKIFLFNICFGNDVLCTAFLSRTKSAVATEYSAENSYWVFLHQRCFLHTTHSKTEMEEGKERIKTEQRRAGKKKEKKKNLFSPSYGGNKELPVLLWGHSRMSWGPNPNS